MSSLCNARFCRSFLKAGCVVSEHLRVKPCAFVMAPPLKMETALAPGIWAQGAALSSGSATGLLLTDRDALDGKSYSRRGAMRPKDVGKVAIWISLTIRVGTVAIWISVSEVFGWLVPPFFFFEIATPSDMPPRFCCWFPCDATNERYPSKQRRDTQPEMIIEWGSWQR